MYTHIYTCLFVAFVLGLVYRPRLFYVWFVVSSYYYYYYDYYYHYYY